MDELPPRCNAMNWNVTQKHNNILRSFAQNRYDFHGPARRLIVITMLSRFVYVHLAHIANIFYNLRKDTYIYEYI